MIKILDKKVNRISLETDMSIALANAIRRNVNFIPILAIDSLEISKNDSALYDEIISNRMGLVPLKNENIKPASECDCGKEEGCSKCSIKLKLSTQGPGIVYSDQLSPKGSAVYKMPITILNKEQELEFVAIAKSKTGIEHAKFSPGIIYYRYSDDLDKEEDESFKELVDESKKNQNKKLNIIIESWGQISAKEIFIQSIEKLNKGLKELLKEID
jgi:DNA-directed RNA polymerase subunit D